MTGERFSVTESSESFFPVFSEKEKKLQLVLEKEYEKQLNDFVCRRTFVRWQTKSGGKEKGYFSVEPLFHPHSGEETF